MQSGGDDRTREDIAKYGCSIMHVMEEGDLPPFAYSIGITQQTGAPEVVAIGLKQPIAHFVLNEYNRRVRAGERIESGKSYSGFLDGFDVFVEDVPLTAYEDYFGKISISTAVHTSRCFSSSIPLRRASGHGPRTRQNRFEVATYPGEGRSRIVRPNPALNRTGRYAASASVAVSAAGRLA